MKHQIVVQAHPINPLSKMPKSKSPTRNTITQTRAAKMRINISSAIAKMIVKNEVHVNTTLTLLELSPENHQKPEELAK